MDLQTPRSHYTTQQRLAALAVAAARRSWARVSFTDLDATWATGIAQAALVVTAAQRTATADAVAYVADVVDEQGITAPPVATVNTAPLTGVATDGRPLVTLLDAPTVRVKQAVAAGYTEERAMASGLSTLDRIVATQVQDAARAAASLAMVSRPALTGYSRMLNPPSCSRCAVLAGAFYRWNTGFQRHPMCDCRHIPSTENVADLTTSPRGYFDSLDAAEQDRIFTRAGAEAIRDGADIGQVVNARRGMKTAQVHGQTVRVTTEGATVRSAFGRSQERLGNVAKRDGQRYRSAPIRLMPEQIYLEADGNRDEALRLLERFGYL